MSFFDPVKLAASKDVMLTGSNIIDNNASRENEKDNVEALGDKKGYVRKKDDS